MQTLVGEVHEHLMASFQFDELYVSNLAGYLCRRIIGVYAEQQKLVSLPNEF